MRLYVFENTEKAIDIARRPRMDQIQIKSGNRRPVQDRAHTAHHDELDLVFRKAPENCQKVRFRFRRHAT